MAIPGYGDRFCLSTFHRIQSQPHAILTFCLLGMQWNDMSKGPNTWIDSEEQTVSTIKTKTMLFQHTYLFISNVDVAK